MKLKTSFVYAPTNLVPALALTSWGLALGMLVLAGYLILSGLEFQKMNTVLANEQHRLQVKLTTIHDVNEQQLTRERYELLKNRIATINRLTGMNGMDISWILSQLESLMPEQCYLQALNYRSVTDDLLLVIESADVSKLTQFIDQLETNGLFSDITIVRQDQVNIRGKKAVQFEIRLKSGKNGRAY